jgi:hypothetical protein
MIAHDEACLPAICSAKGPILLQCAIIFDVYVQAHLMLVGPYSYDECFSKV